MKTVHLYIFGIGNVGSTLIEQVLAASSFFKEKHQLDLRIVGIVNSSRVLCNASGISKEWKTDFAHFSTPRQPDSFYNFALLHDEVRIAVDATASKELSTFYPELVQKGFHIVTANKIANTLSQDFYDHLRRELHVNNLSFEYETNVGAGLPIVATVKDLTNSGEHIAVINGVFSGSLGYIFNRFSQEETPISSIIKDALTQGYTEPDPREDLSGNDVARKLLVLARETGLKLEFEDISIENLVTPELQELDLKDFLNNLSNLDASFDKLKHSLLEDEVLRHVGSLNTQTKQLTVSLQKVKKDSPAGQLSGSDGFFEVYSSSYKTHPLVIKGAGAGREVTARGLLSDIIKVANRAETFVYSR
ncbi:MAG: aspartate kinase [Nonlabens sp.]|nr:aspartate kinase [Nonlabens sp.]